MADNKLDISISGSLPFEAVLTKAMDIYIRVRESMDQTVRDEWDKMFLEDYKRIRAIWLKITGQG